MRFKLFLVVVGILACTSSAKAQGMEPNYTYTQLIYWLPSNSGATAVEAGVGVYGNTICYDRECPVDVTHHSDLFAGIGSEGQECVGPDVAPSDEIDEDCSMAIALSFWDAHGSVYGDVICSQLGSISTDPGGVEDKYWENQVAFVKAVANSLNVTTDCTYPNDTSPDWFYNTNPYGMQGSTPNPAIIEEMRLAYTSNSSGYGPFTPFPNGFDGISGTTPMDYGAWSGSMPQECTQHASGETSFTPTWQANP